MPVAARSIGEALVSIAGARGARTTPRRSRRRRSTVSAELGRAAGSIDQLSGVLALAHDAPWPSSRAARAARSSSATRRRARTSSSTFAVSTR